MNHPIMALAIAVAAGPVLGGLAGGLDRIVTARCQARVGPPLWQPYFDVIKLLAKEQVVINGWQAFCACNYLFATMLALVLFFMQSDLLLILFIQAVGAVFLVMGALASTSPYSQLGAHRELMQMLSYEPLLFLAGVGIYLETGSFTIETVFLHDAPLILKLPLLFFPLCLVLVIKLRKSPFDLSASHHAHQELVRGVLTDFSGPLLGMIEIGHWYETVLMLGYCGLFWATGPVPMVLLAMVVYGAVIVVDNATARLNWRWMMLSGWIVGLSMCLVNLIWRYHG